MLKSGYARVGKRPDSYSENDESKGAPMGGHGGGGGGHGGGGHCGGGSYGGAGRSAGYRGAGAGANDGLTGPRSAEPGGVMAKIAMIVTVAWVTLCAGFFIVMVVGGIVIAVRAIATHV